MYTVIGSKVYLLSIEISCPHKYCNIEFNNINLKYCNIISNTEKLLQQVLK